MSGATGRESDKFMLRLPDGLRDQIKQLAENNGRSMNAEVVDAIRAAIKSYEARKATLAYYDKNPKTAEAAERRADFEARNADELHIRSLEDVDQLAERFAGAIRARLRQDIFDLLDAQVIRLPGEDHDPGK